MKTKLTRNLIALGVTLAMLQSASFIRAANNSDENLQEYDGTVARADAKEHTLKVKRFFLSKTFNLADDCLITLAPAKPANALALQPGMEVAVKYQDADGVSVASRVDQMMHTHIGHIKTVSPGARELTTEDLGFSHKVKLAEDCEITLHGKEATPADLKIGQQVEITYTKMADLWWAHKVVDATETYTGTVQAVDISSDTLKVRHLLVTKKFNLGDGCRIVIGNNDEAKLADLRIGQTVTVDFENIKGVFVASRVELQIAPEDNPKPVVDSKPKDGLSKL